MMRDKRLRLMTDVFVEVVQNYIDKFTIYQIPFQLQLIHYNNQLQVRSLTLDEAVRIFERIIVDLKQIDTLLELRDLRHLKICQNLPQLLTNLVSAPACKFKQLHDQLLTVSYLSSISYKEFKTDAMETGSEQHILHNQQFLDYHQDRKARVKINERRVFGGGRA